MNARKQRDAMYIESGLGDRVVAVLVNNALCFLLEPLYDARRPPFLQVTRLVVLATCSHTDKSVYLGG